jgi:hypothetical protein
MKFPILMAGAAAIALCAGAASAATHKSANTFAAPSQPIAYAKLDAYLKATPRQRAQGDWANDQTAAAAQTGTPANASAQSGMNAQAPAQNDMSAPAGQVTPPAAAPDAAPPAADASPAPAAPPASAPQDSTPPQDNTSPPPATPNT